ncbi:hypothetical protein GCM10029964_034050 [Kibdelosporangium lantanae]
MKSVSQREIGVEKILLLRFHELGQSWARQERVMTTIERRVSTEDEQEGFDVESELDDDYFEPTIVRGRE